MVAAKLESPEVGIQWIANTLFGPGHYPDIEAARELGGAQALFDKEMAEHEAFRAAHPAPVADQPSQAPVVQAGDASAPAVRMLTEDEVAQATEDGERSFRRWTQGVRGQTLMPQDSPTFHYVMAGAAKALAAFRAAIIADLCGDVEPVAIYHGRCVIDCGEHGHLDMQLLKMIPAGTALCTASTVAALKAERDAALARVAELEKDAEPEEFTRGIDAAAKMLDKMADDYSNAHAVQDPDTGVYEFGRGAKEDYYNTLRELADDIRSIVYTPGERENTEQTLKAAKDAAFEQAANLLECEYAEDARQSRRLYQIAQHIRDLKKGSL